MNISFRYRSLVLLLLAPFSAHAETAPAYQLVPLEALPHQRATQAFDINNQGTTVGVSSPMTSTGSSVNAVQWNDTGSATPLPIQEESFVTTVNSLGHVAGNVDLGGSVIHAFLWNGSNQIDIHTSGEDSYTFGMNDLDEVAGWYVTLGKDVAYVWSNGTRISLGFLGGDESRAISINNAGQAIGYAESANGNDRAFVWSDANGNKVSDPGEMVQLPDNGISSAATAINELGQIVGFVSTPTITRQPVVWNDTSSFTTLPIPSGETSAEISSINNLGEIVGFAGSHALLWQDGTVYDLNTLIGDHPEWLLRRAASINDDGWIVGVGTVGGIEKGFLLIPVPEVSSVVLLLSALLAWPLGHRILRSSH